MGSHMVALLMLYLCQVTRATYQSRTQTTKVLPGEYKKRRPASEDCTSGEYNKTREGLQQHRSWGNETGQHTCVTVSQVEPLMVSYSLCTMLKES